MEMMTLGLRKIRTWKVLIKYSSKDGEGGEGEGEQEGGGKGKRLLRV